jgi:thiol:disulfide interchange protein
VRSFETSVSDSKSGTGRGGAWLSKVVLRVVALCVVGVPAAGLRLQAFEEPMVSVWRADFQVAEEQAKAQQLPMLIHFGATWCGPCRQMERNVLGTAQVRESLSEGIVGVKVDSDRRRDLMKRFGVSVLPTDVVIAPDGKVLLRQVGYTDAKSYSDVIRRFRKPNAAPVAGEMPTKTGTAGAG